ncbi:MAG: hypothetical protein ACFFBD_12525 [Candidatus Hodarchaeota archaeon]
MTIATFLSLLFSMSRFVFPYFGDASSEVTSRMMAVMASQRLMSEKDSGKFISLVLNIVIATNFL